MESIKKFEIMTLKKLYEEDAKELNFRYVPSDQLYEIVKNSNRMNSKIYLEECIFKHGINHSYIGIDGKILTYTACEYVEWKMINENLKRWFDEEVEPYRETFEAIEGTIDKKNKRFSLVQEKQKEIEIETETKKEEPEPDILDFMKFKKYNGKCVRSSIYEDYEKYCDENKLKPKQSKDLYIRIRSLDYVDEKSIDKVKYFIFPELKTIQKETKSVSNSTEMKNLKNVISNFF